MSRCCLVLIFTGAICLAQTREPSDAWLMQNYRFAPPPAPGEPATQSSAVSQLQEVQATTLGILHRANLDGNYDAALAAARQAAANAQMLGIMTGEWKPPAQPARPVRPAEAAPERKPEAPTWLIAFKDRSVQAAEKIWADKLMLHYITRTGAHEQVRLDLVDWERSTELNRGRPYNPNASQALRASGVMDAR
jgi:hypothetical protein